jgi:hypothetical protein
MSLHRLGIVSMRMGLQASFGDGPSALGIEATEQPVS